MNADEFGKLRKHNPKGFLLTVSDDTIGATYWTDDPPQTDEGKVDGKVLAHNLFSGLVANLTQSKKFTKWELQKILNTAAKE